MYRAPQRAEFDQRFQEIVDFILSYGTKDEAERKIIAALSWAPFRKSSDDQLLPIRQMEVNKAIAKIKSDASLSDAEKTAKIAPLQAQFEELGKKIAALPRG